MNAIRLGVLLLALIYPQFSYGSSVIEPDAFWRTFRALNPLFVQDMVASSQDESGRRLLLVSEPPPHLSDRLQQIFGRVFGEAYLRHDIFTQPIGYDGWVKDVVISLHYPIQTEHQFDRDVAALNVEAFGT